MSFSAPASTQVNKIIDWFYVAVVIAVLRGINLFIYDKFCRSKAFVKSELRIDRKDLEMGFSNGFPNGFWAKKCANYER